MFVCIKCCTVIMFFIFDQSFDSCLFLCYQLHVSVLVAWKVFPASFLVLKVASWCVGLISKGGH